MMEITLEKNDDGFLASCLSIDGAFAEGDTEFDALYNLFDVIHMLKDYKKDNTSNTVKDKIEFQIPITL